MVRRFRRSPLGGGLVSDELVITVEDNGIGIPLDEKQKIFEKGYGRNTGLASSWCGRSSPSPGSSFTRREPTAGARFEITVPKGAYRTANAP